MKGTNKRIFDPRLLTIVCSLSVVMGFDSMIRMLAALHTESTDDLDLSGTIVCHAAQTPSFLGDFDTFNVSFATTMFVDYFFFLSTVLM